jgi:hypothetical protein
MNIKALRISNFLIDTLLYTIFIFVFFSYFKNNIPKENVYVISIVFYFMYYFLQESLFKKTIGKRITKTEVITKSETKDFYLLKILIRTLTRLIIIDALSYLFTNNGFHDLFSNTQTIKTIR